MRPLRVLHVAPYCGDAWAYGGIPRVVEALTAGLTARGHQVTLCTTDACDASVRLDSRARAFRSWAPSLGGDGVVRRVFPNISTRAAYHAQLFVPIGLAQYLRRHAHDFDLAHLHACRNVPGVIAAHYLAAAGVPYVLAPNGTAPNIERRWLPKHIFDLAFGRRVMAGAARMIAVTGAERSQLLHLGVPDARIRIVPNPLDLSECSPPPAPGAFRADRIPPGAPIVLFLGKLTPRKRLDVLIRAFAQVQDASGRSSNAWLVIAGNDMGSGSAAHALAQRLGLQNRTIFTGLLRGRQRLEALADADVVVYPSQDEIFGLVPLEALLMGTPVIVAGDSGCGEVVARVAGGPIVAVGDDTALAAAIQQVLDDPDRWRSVAKEAAERVRAAFSRDVVCAALEEMYLEMAAERTERLAMRPRIRPAGHRAVHGVCD